MTAEPQIERMEKMTTKRTRIANFALCASLAAALLTGASLATAADQDLWLATRVF
jgi:hypothetical protein